MGEVARAALASAIRKLGTVKVGHRLTDSAIAAWVCGEGVAVAQLRYGAEAVVVLNDLVGRAMYLWGEDDPRLTSVLDAVLCSGDTALDIGANFGVVGLLACKKVGEKGKVHLFEPQPVVAQCLRTSILINGYRQAVLGQRIFGIACGYADANDAARLAEDPVHKMLIGRDPVEGQDLASQPTICRFENAPDRKQLYRMGEALADCVLERHRQRLHGRAKLITFDLDVTDDPTHGAQQLTFFNSHYDTWCYLPLLGFVSFNDEKEQYLCAAVLRPGNAPASRGAIGILWRILQQVWAAFPKARVRVRLDGGFADPLLLDFLDTMGVEYVVAMAKNAVLNRWAEPQMEQARQLSQASGKTEHVYGEARYRAGSWSAERRVIFKAEVVRQEGNPSKDNPRFVITNLKQHPQGIYEQVYCQRGQTENHIKELHYGLEIDRTSCTSFLANQFRVLMTAAAYVLLQEIRLRAARTPCARAQVWMLRERLLKLGAHVVRSVRRVVLHLPHSFPFLDTFRQVALALGARAG